MGANRECGATVNGIEVLSRPPTTTQRRRDQALI